MSNFLHTDTRQCSLGVDTEAVDYNMRTPLHCTVLWDRDATTSVLLDAGDSVT